MEHVDDGRWVVYRGRPEKCDLYFVIATSFAGEFRTVGNRVCVRTSSSSYWIEIVKGQFVDTFASKKAALECSEALNAIREVHEL